MEENLLEEVVIYEVQRHYGENLKAQQQDTEALEDTMRC